MIFIECKTALCNRLMAIDSGLAIAEELNRPCTIIWHYADTAVNCDIFDLFEKHRNLKNIYRIPNRKEHLLKYIWFRFIRYHFLIFSSENIFQFKTLLSALGHINILEQIRTHKKTHIKTWIRFYTDGRPFKSFQPKKHIEQVVNRVSSEFSNTIGIHIRRGDFRTQLNSPTDLFITKMNEALVADPSVNFFLCTDDPSVEQNIVSIFGDKILKYNKRSLDRKTKEALEDALIDLYSLAQTKRIIGCQASTYSQTAAEIGNIKLEELAITPSIMSMRHIT